MFSRIFPNRSGSSLAAAALAAAAVAGLAGAGAVNASVIYQAFTASTASTSEALSGLGLNSTPTPGLAVDNGPNPGSDTWTPSTAGKYSYPQDFSTDGTQVSLSAPVVQSGGYNYGASESLPVTLTPSTTYVLSGVFNVTNTNGVYMGIGIGPGVVQLSGSGWVGTRTAGFNQNGGAQYKPYNRTGTLTVTLATASNLATGNSMLTFTDSVGSWSSTPVTVTGLSSTSNIAVYQYDNATGSIKDLSLTSLPSSVPEPASLALVAAGGLGLLLLGRKRKFT